MKRIVMIVALVLSASVAHAGTAQMTLAEFRQRNDAAQSYMIVGVIQLTNKLQIACAHEVTVGEYKAALKFRDVPTTQPWIDVLMELMDERGCRVQTAKGDA